MRIELGIFAGIVGFLVGVALYDAWRLPVLFVLVGVALCFVVTIWVFQRERYLLVVIVASLGLLLGMARMWLGVLTVPDVVHPYINARVTIEGIVIDEPDIRETNTRLTLKVTRVANTTLDEPVRVLVSVRPFPEFVYGDVLRVSGSLKLPSTFATDNARLFDYPRYLAARGIALVMFYPQTTRIATDSGNPVQAALFDFKSTIRAALARVLAEPHNALVAGILLGAKQSLGTMWLTYFQNSGLIHIVVLSGTNMAIIAYVLGRVAMRGGVHVGSVVAIIGIIAFTVMVGASATVVRAAMMSIIGILAVLIGRRYDAGRALVFAGLIMVLLSPHILLGDPSFQLSFLAACGMITLTPLLAHYITWWKGVPVLRDIILTTLATQLIVFPFLLYLIGQFPLLSFLANLLALPAVPVLMLLGFVTLLCALVATPLGIAAALPTSIISSWILFVAQTIGSWSPAVGMVRVVSFPATLLFLIYACCAVLLIRWYRAHPFSEQAHPTSQGY